MSAMDIFARNVGSKGRVSGILHGISTRFAQYRTYRKTLDELESLSNREMADLGIHRSQLRSIAYKAAYDG
ncbi:MAG: DUF1127 domain-containing protein [Pseudomonadota bacterium]